MKCSNPACNRGIGLISYRRGWLSSDGRYCSKLCRNALVADSPNQQRKRKDSMLRRFVVASVAFVGLIIPATFTMAVLAAPPARHEASPSSACDRDLAEASANAAAMQARVKASANMDSSDVCRATQLYFLEVVKARAVTALCKSGPERDRDLERLDANVAHINDAIAARCL